MKDIDQGHFERYLSGELSLEDLVEMIDGLENSADARATLLRMSLLETQLYETMLSDEQSATTNDLLRPLDIDAPRESSSTVSPHGQRQSLSPMALHWKSLLAGASIAALVLVAIAFWQRSDSGSSEIQKDRLPVAYLSRAVEANWSQSDKSSGDDLVNGEVLQLESGQAEITFMSGARAILTGPAKIELTGPNSARLVAGSLVASVPPEATDFRVDTPTTTVIDIGTEFGMHVDDQGTAEVQVFRGEVDVEVPRHDNKPESSAVPESIRVVEGQQVRVDASAITQGIPPVERGLMRNPDFTRLTSKTALRDDFEALDLNTQLWRRSVLAPSSDIQVRDGQARLINRGHLATREQFDPIRLGGIKITGRWTFVSPTDAPGNQAVCMLSIVTRGLSQQGTLHHDAASGIDVTMFSDSTWPRIFARGTEFEVSKERRTGKIADGFQVGRTYEFEVIDDGLAILARVTDVDDPTQQVESIARVLRDESDTDHVLFYSREKHYFDSQNDYTYEVGLDDLEIITSTGPCR